MTDQDQHNKMLRLRSGEVDSDCRVASFLYDLMRDHVPPGIVEKITRNSLKTPTRFTNGWLAEYAMDVAHRLKHGMKDEI